MAGALGPAAGTPAGGAAPSRVNAGDELVCLTALSDDNLTAAGVRMVRGSAR